MEFSPERHGSMCRGVFHFPSLGNERVLFIGFQWVEARPKMHEKAPENDCPVQNVNSAKVTPSCSSLGFRESFSSL